MPCFDIKVEFFCLVNILIFSDLMALKHLYMFLKHIFITLFVLFPSFAFTKTPLPMNECICLHHQRE